MPSSVTTAIRKIRVRPASRTASAISLGVFRRSAPSTMAIILSRKVEPASDVMRTLIQSETTVVPPVTAERSPPLSRITGALSPVIAASLTEAMPSTISPSEGITSPASTSTTWPTRSSLAGVGTTVPRSGSLTSLASVVTRVARRHSADPWVPGRLRGACRWAGGVSAGCDRAEHLEVLDDRAKGEGGEELQSAHHQDHSDQETDKQRAVRGKGAGRGTKLGLGG